MRNKQTHKAIFAMKQFKMRAWLASCSESVLKDYKVFVEGEKNFDRVCKGSLNFMGDFIKMKAQTI